MIPSACTSDLERPIQPANPLPACLPSPPLAPSTSAASPPLSPTGAALCGHSSHTQVQPYVDSANDAATGALWPLVRRARLLGPWGRHIGSAVLVDAPGVQDDNSARDRLVSG